MSFRKQIVLKKDTKDEVYTRLCNLLEKDGYFVACGSCDDKWILVDFDSEKSCMDYLKSI
jgi:hypothetical protein